MTMAEEALQREAVQVSLTLAQPHVRGCWEERLPLGLEAALRAGAVAELAPAARACRLADGFEITDLQARLPLTLIFADEGCVRVYSLFFVRPRTCIVATPRP